VVLGAIGSVALISCCRREFIHCNGKFGFQHCTSDGFVVRRAIVVFVARQIFHRFIKDSILSVIAGLLGIPPLQKIVQAKYFMVC